MARMLVLLGALAVLVLPATIGAQEAPSNDDFLSAGSLPAQLHTDAFPQDVFQGIDGATLEDGERQPECGSIGASVWFEVLSLHDATVMVEDTGSDTPVVLAVYRLASFVPSPPEGESLAIWGCNADAGGAVLAFPVSQGERYFLQAGFAAGASGTLRLRLDCDPACRPSNDDAARATGFSEFEMPFREFRSNASATLEAGEPQPCGNIGATLWYTFSVTEPRAITASAQAPFDAAIAAYSQEGLVPSPPGAIQPIACDDSVVDRTVALAFEAEPGVAYYVQVGGQDGATGEVEVIITCDVCPLIIDSPDTGGGGQGGGGGPPVTAPDTGSGGYR